MKVVPYTKYILIVILIVLKGLIAGAFAQETIKVIKLQCNHLTDPAGVVNVPHFSWKMVSDENNQSETAYQIIITGSLKNLSGNIGDVWNSKKVQSSEQLNIPFQGKTLISSKIYYWKVRIWDKDGKVSSWSAPASFITGLLHPADFKAKWITSKKAIEQPLPIFRKTFQLKEKPENMIVHICGLGYYELYVNGKRVGDHVLDPAQTNYDDYAFYVTYDIDTLLQKGANTIGVMLGDGFYNQNVVWGGNLTYGAPLFWCQLDMVSGVKINHLISDTSWKWANGPVLSSNVYAGEVYDARKEIQGWAKNKCPYLAWKPVFEAKDHPTVLKPQAIQPIKKITELKIKQFYKSVNGSYVFDMGQNFAGWNRLRIKAPEGTEVTLKMAEELYSDGTPNFSTSGVFATHVVQTEKYICKGRGEEIWEPRFTYHGYRYVQVEGLPFPPDSNLLTSIVVHSAVPPAGTFTCSNPQINKIHQLSYWTLISNLYGIPTDCPQREKCGWLGDAHTMAESTIYNFDMENFYLKYLDDIHSTARNGAYTIFHLGLNKNFRKGYKEPGIPFMIAPGKRLTAAASPDWGTAVVQLPWYLYTYYGNVEVLKKFYPDMKRWIQYIDNLAKDYIVYEGLGDWCPPGDIKNIDCPVPLSSTAFHYNDLIIMKSVAGLLGHRGDSRVFANAALLVKKAFIQKFYDPLANTYGSQTANAMALNFGLVPKGKEKLISDAIVKMSNEKFHGFMYSGIFGLKRLFDQLSRNGNEQAAYDILNKKGDYSFELMWKKYKATTLWEVLPVNIDYMKNETEETARRSHNHPMQAGFDAWFFYGILGINPDIDFPGFKKIIFQPYLLNQLTSAAGQYESSYGQIKSAYNWNKDTCRWTIEIPVNTVGEIRLTQSGFETVEIDGSEIRHDDNGFHCKVSPGKHTVTIIRKENKKSLQ